MIGAIVRFIIAARPLLFSTALVIGSATLYFTAGPPAPSPSPVEPSPIASTTLIPVPSQTAAPAERSPEATVTPEQAVATPGPTLDPTAAPTPVPLPAVPTPVPVPLPTAVPTAVPTVAPPIPTPSPSCEPLPPCFNGAVVCICLTLP